MFLSEKESYIHCCHCSLGTPTLGLFEKIIAAVAEHSRI